MATGAYDSNGIYKYGEDDNISLFSATLNKLADSTSDGFTTDRSRLSVLEAGSLAGLVPVKPAVATFVTGTGAVSSVGAVSFTGCSAVSLDSLFTAAFKNYVFVYTANKTTAGNANITMRLRNGSGDVSLANYGWQLARAEGGTMFPSRVDTTTQWSLAFNSYGLLSSGSLDIFQPNEPAITTFSGQFNLFSYIGDVTLAGGGYSATTQFTGLSLIFSAPCSGTIQVFGYND